MTWLLYLALVSNHILAHSILEPPAYQALPEGGDLLSFSLSTSWIVPASDPSVILEHTPLKEGVERIDNSKILEARRVWKTHGSTVAARGDIEAWTSVPDISDRQTLSTLAKATNEAYYPIPRDRTDWRPAYNRSEPFGWQSGEDGLRGHVFLTSDSSAGLVAFKGTSMSEWTKIPNTGTRSEARDKWNDNALFSCCCSGISWQWNGERTNASIPCDAGGQRCNSRCISDTLQSSESYYSVGVSVMEHILATHPNTSFWLAGHSLGGSIASLMSQKFSLPVVAFEAPPERLASERLGLFPPSTPQSEHLITHVFNTVDPLASGSCGTPCMRLGYQFDSKCHLGQQVILKAKKKSWWQKQFDYAVMSHQIINVIALLSDESVPIPAATPAPSKCDECLRWNFGDGDEHQPPPPGDGWWKWLKGLFGSDKSDKSAPRDGDKWLEDALSWLEGVLGRVSPTVVLLRHAWL